MCLTSAYRDLLKHSSIYGLGHILSRLASVVLLPVYTRYLTPADYGCIALLDLTAAVLTIFVGSGMASAVTRYHFEWDEPAKRGRVWWTGLTFVAVMATVLVVPAWFARGVLAELTLGPDIAEGPFYFTLALPTIWFGTVTQVAAAYLRVQKWSGLVVGLSLVRLLLNIAINVYFLVVLGLGVAGLLWGNLIASVVTMAAMWGVFAMSEGRYRFDWPLARALWRYGAPLIVTSLLALIMHDADRYLLRLFLDLHDVGVYSLAYNIGHSVEAMCVMPFASIWGVVVFEIAARPDAKQVYAQVFEYFVFGLGLVMFGVCLFAKPLLAVLADEQYAGAADLVPVVCLAYLFFGLHDHFRVPALIAKRTVSLLPAFVVAAAANLGLNFALIPVMGASGAAWASVVTFAIFSFVGLWRYRLIDRYPYPLARCGVRLAGMVACYAAYRGLEQMQVPRLWLVGAGVALWAGWATILFGDLARRALRGRLWIGSPKAAEAR